MVAPLCLVSHAENGGMVGLPPDQVLDKQIWRYVEKLPPAIDSHEYDAKTTRCLQ